MKIAEFLLVTLVSMTLTIQGCKKADGDAGSEDDTEDAVLNTFESVIGEATAAGNSISGFPTFYPSRVEAMTTSPGDTCAISTHRSACETEAVTGDKIRTVDWNACVIGTTSAVQDGVVVEKFSGFGAAVCSLTQADSDPAMASTVTRKITTPVVTTFATGATLTSDMEPDTAFDGTTFASAATGTTIRRYDANFTDSNSIAHTCGTSTNSCFRMVVNGQQNVLVGPRGRTWFDHIITSDLTLKGDRSSGNYQVNGTSTVWHQLAEYKAVQTFTGVTWTDNSCCFPTSGTISSVLTGTVAGTASVAFTSTCGTVTLTDAAGAVTTAELSQNQCRR